MQSLKAAVVVLAAINLVAAGSSVVADAAPGPKFGACPVDANVPAGSGTECAALHVPMDYHHPDGKQIDLTVSRIKATGQRHGVMFLNPGGPGADTLGYWAHRAKNLPAELAEHYDRIAVQPRGLRWSTPLTCAAGQTPGQKVQPGAGLRRDIKAACDVAQPGYLQTITTENTARDIDAVRTALGLDRIDFIGMSYGTYLGAVYATLFPDHVDKLILDSNVNPGWVWTEQFAQQQLAGKNRFDDLFRWIADHNDTYQLGDTPLKVYENWASQAAAQGGGWFANLTPPPATAEDVPAAIPQPVGRMITDAYNGSLDQISKLQNFIRALASHGGSQDVPLLAATAVASNTRLFWPQFAHAMAAAHADPTDVAQLVSIGQETTADPTSRYVFSAITCNENAVPPEPNKMADAMTTLSLGGSALEARADLVRTGLACTGWAPAAKPIKPTGANLRNQPLLLQSLHDAETTYDGGVAMAKAMNGNLITVEGGDHGTFGRGNTALDNAVMAYLESGQVTLSRVDQAPLPAR